MREFVKVWLLIPLVKPRLGSKLKETPHLDKLYVPWYTCPGERSTCHTTQPVFSGDELPRSLEELDYFCLFQIMMIDEPDNEIIVVMLKEQHTYLI